MDYKHRNKLAAFTIVELLVVIVVIGILASATILSYTGVSQKAYLASMQSGLDVGYKSLQLFQIENTTYPLTIDCNQPESTTNHCVRLNDEVGNKKVFINGVLHSTKTIPALPMSGNTNNLLISNSSTVCPNGYGSFPGLISDILVYNKALSDTAVKSLYDTIK